MKIAVNGTVRDMTTEELVQRDQDILVFENRKQKALEEQITSERDRRIASGFSFLVRGVSKTFQSDTESIQRITGAATLAGFAKLAGAQTGDFLWTGTDPFSWITLDNEVVHLDAHEMFALGQAAADHVTRHIFLARALKNQTSLPQDVSADEYWI